MMELLPCAEIVHNGSYHHYEKGHLPLALHCTVYTHTNNMKAQKDVKRAKAIKRRKKITTYYIHPLKTASHSFKGCPPRRVYVQRILSFQNVGEADGHD